MDELIALSQGNLARLPGTIRAPKYDRSRLQSGILHVGLGNFHRAHQAWYLHRLFEANLCSDWAIVGAGVRPQDAIIREKLLAQDCLTSLIELDPSNRSVEICGAMTDFVPVEEGNATLIARMAQPDIRIVSLTITEGGYYIDPASGGFDEQHADIAHDVQHPERPITVFGAIIAALKIRRANSLGPFTVQSCDNLQGNGAITRRAVVRLAQLTDLGLADWIAENCSFPNSMVDCIVPATGPKEIALAHEFGIDDKVPVTHENFRQWVIEDDFCAGRPDWDRVGVTFSDRVHEFEAMKLRILNGGHQIIAVPGELLDTGTIAATMAHPLIHGLLQKAVTEEVAPYVKDVPGATAKEYLGLIDRRFSNPEIEDTTRRVAFDGSSRQPGFIVPSIRDALKAGGPVDGLALISAMWARYCQGRRENGENIEPNDPNWDFLQETALKAENEPVRWLEMRQYYGDLSSAPDFVDAFSNWFRIVCSHGSEAAMSTYLAK